MHVEDGDFGRYVEPGLNILQHLFTVEVSNGARLTCRGPYSPIKQNALGGQINVNHVPGTGVDVPFLGAFGMVGVVVIEKWRQPRPFPTGARRVENGMEINRRVGKTLEIQCGNRRWRW